MPNVANVHINRALSNYAQGIRNKGLIASDIFKDVRVQNRTDIYWKYDVERREAAKAKVDRTPGAKAEHVDFTRQQATYRCDARALAATIPDEEVLNQDAPINAVMDKIDHIKGRLDISREIDVAAAMAAGVSGVTLTDEWDDYTNGTPISDIETGINTIEDAIGGLQGNLYMSMDSKVWRAVKSHPDIVDRVKYATASNENPADISTTGFARLFDLTDVFISTALKNTAEEGQTASMSRVWGDTVYLFYRTESPTLMDQSFAKSFLWRPEFVKRWRDDERESEMVKVEKNYDDEIVFASAAYKIANTLT